MRSGTDYQRAGVNWKACNEVPKISTPFVFYFYGDRIKDRRAAPSVKPPKA